MYVEIGERATLVPQNASEEDWMAPRYAPQLISPPAFIQAIDNKDIVVRAQHLTCQFCGDDGRRMLNKYQQFECPVMQERTLNWQVKYHCPHCGVPNQPDENICLSGRNPMRRAVVRKNLEKYRACSGHGQAILNDLLEKMSSQE